MAVNKNFVVKNGLEVDTNLILADATTNKVGIGTSVPQYPLHVFGGIGVTDSYVAGVSTIRNELNVGTGGTIFTVIATEAQDQFVGIRTANPAFLLDVRSPVSTGQTALYVQGDARITGNTNIEGDINIDEVNIRNLNVTGLSTFVGFVTFRESVAIQTSLYVGGISTFVGQINNVGGGATIGNVQIGITNQNEIDTRDNILILDSADGQVTVDDRLRVVGIATFDSNVAISGTFGVAGFSTFADSVMIQDNFQVGGISTFVGVSSFLNDVDVRGNFTLAGSVSLDTDLYIVGVATIGTLDVDGNANIDGTLSGRNSTEALVVGTGISVAGISTLAGSGGITTTGGDLYVGGNLYTSGGVILDTDLYIVGVATIGTLKVTGLTTSRDLEVTGFSTFVGLSSFQSGLINAGVTTSNAYTVDGTQVISSSRELQNIASLDATTTATIEAAIANAPNTFTDITVSGVSTFVGLATFSSGIEVVAGVTTLGGYVDINNSLDVSGTINVGGISTFVGFSTFKNDVYVAGIVTATAFHGDGSNLTGSASGLNAAIGIGSEGVFIGAGVTQLNFNTTTGTNVAVSAATAGIATVTITPGVSLGLAIALGG